MKFTIDAEVVEVDAYPELLFVDKSSTTSHKDSLASLAYYFKKEMRFDHLQFDKDMYGNDDYTGFLILKRAMDLVEHEDHYPSRIIGGGVFVKTNENFKLDWIWIHPFERNKGTLKSRWTEFQKKFGHFGVTEPLSAQMSAFLAKHSPHNNSFKPMPLHGTA